MQFPLYVDHERLETSVLYLAAIDDAGLIVVAAFATGFAHRPSPIAGRVPRRGQWGSSDCSCQRP